MDGIGLLIFICFGITFVPPVVFFLIALGKRKSDRNAAKVFFILATAWLIIGGGMCLSIMTEGS